MFYCESNIDRKHGKHAVQNVMRSVDEMRIPSPYYLDVLDNNYFKTKDFYNDYRIWIHVLVSFVFSVFLFCFRRRSDIDNVKLNVAMIPQTRFLPSASVPACINVPRNHTLADCVQVLSQK